MQNLVHRWAVLALVREAIEQLQEYAPERTRAINPEDQERAAHLATLLRRWARGEEPDSTEAFYRVCQIIDVPPDVVRRAIRL